MFSCSYINISLPFHYTSLFVSNCSDIYNVCDSFTYNDKKIYIISENIVTRSLWFQYSMHMRVMESGLHILLNRVHQLHTLFAYRTYSPYFTSICMVKTCISCFVISHHLECIMIDHLERPHNTFTFFP